MCVCPLGWFTAYAVGRADGHRHCRIRASAGTDIVGCGMSDTARPGPGRVGKLYIFHAWLAEKKGKKEGRKIGKKRREGAFIMVKHFCKDLIYSFLAGSFLSVA
jgi:hypothetical protein